jgi:acyl-CoA synthetase (NDP forming)/RimJ/RimL family protein N-acetyltransferase
MTEDLARWAGDVVLSDGGTVHVRPMVREDAPGIQALHERLSPETVYLRFFSALPKLSAPFLERLTNVDHDDRYALVAELGPVIIGVARYDRIADEPDAAEVAFVVDDAHQGRGLGGLLLEQLAAVAREHHVSRFVADTLPGNARMLKVFHDAGFEDERHYADGVIRIGFPILETERSLAVQYEREQHASARSVSRLLAPRSVAVIGASNRAGSVGHAILANLLAGAFTGPVHPVHRTERSVAGVRAWPTIGDVPDDIDLAVVAVPAAQVAQIVDECGAKGVAGLVVVATGFREAGPAGAAAERTLVERARRLGMRMIGPASLGIANTDPSVRLQATVAPQSPRPGRVGFVSQSGALGIAILDELHRVGLGVSTFVSLGNRADVSANDLLSWWHDDPGTDVVVLHLERFGNPRRFARTARRVSRRKPIVALKANRFRTAPGSESAGALAVGSEQAVEALFAQAGVVRVDTFDQLFSAARALASQPLPAGRRVAVVGNGGGSTLVAVDALLARELEVGEPAELRHDAGPAEYLAAVSSALADDTTDSVLAVFLPALEPHTAEVAQAVAAAAAAQPLGRAKPVVGLFVVRGGMLPRDAPPSAVPLYRFPESAAIGLDALATCGAHQRRPVGHLPPLEDADVGAARLLVEALGEPAGDTWLTPVAAAELVGHLGIAIDPVPPGAAEGEHEEATVGVIQDPSFGPLVALRLGSRPAQHRILPLTDVDADDLLDRAAPDLRAPARAALRTMLLRVGHLLEAVPEVAELALEPVIVTADTAVAAGVRARIARPEARPELALRRL